MQKFREICIFTYKDNTHWAKLYNQGTPDIWVGYAEGNPTGSYWIFQPQDKKYYFAQDVTFLQKSYNEYSKVEKPILVTTSYEGLDNEEELE